MTEVRQVTEYQSIGRRKRGDRRISMLWSLDDEQAKSSQNRIFREVGGEICTQSYVGVVSVPGLTLEILPKLQHKGDLNVARSNLLFMLEYANLILARDARDADLLHECMSLLEAFIAAFADRLLRELKRGTVSGYVGREENLTCVRGKILYHQHVIKNCLHQERVYVAYDEFTADTSLNRVIKCGCLRLQSMTEAPATRRKLVEALVRLENVGGVLPSPQEVQSVIFHRGNFRMREPFLFCKKVLAGRSPGPAVGDESSFSLLFPMQYVFERFIANFTRENSAAFGWREGDIESQGESEARHLLKRRSDGRPMYRLKPDMVVSQNGKPALIVDTKWKRLKRKKGKSVLRASHDDIYQLYAYAKRFECADNLLLFPRAERTREAVYGLEDDEDTILRVGFVDVTCDYRRDTTSLLEDLKRVFGTSGTSMR